MKNPKVAIVTIISKNYGNRLQNFALQECLIRMGYEVYTVPYKLRIKIIMKEKIKALLSSLFTYFRNRWVWECFNRKYIKWVALNPNYNSMSDKFSFFITGSDQVWNPLFCINSEREFLTFCERKKRIAYAASIGIDVLPEECFEKYKQYINGIPNISVREDKAADIIYNLTGKRVPIVIDPTMLLSSEDWMQVISVCKITVPNRYVVTYFLGSKVNDYQAYIKEKANAEGLEVIELLDASGNAKAGIGPLEFVYYIANSERTYVDSFHGTVFSILFQKSFFVLERPYEEGAGLMTSRLDTLLSIFGMNDRLIRSLVQLEEIEGSCDFSNVTEILNTKRQEALDYLKDAMKIERG